MLSMITNIYNKKTKGPTLMELFTATGKMKKFFFFFFGQLEMFDVWTAGDTTRIDTILKFLPHTHKFFSFPLAVNNSVKVDPMVFLL
jgi:hypothetical protein